MKSCNVIISPISKNEFALEIGEYQCLIIGDDPISFTEQELSFTHILIAYCEYRKWLPILSSQNIKLFSPSFVQEAKKLNHIDNFKYMEQISEILKKIGILNSTGGSNG